MKHEILSPSEDFSLSEAVKGILKKANPEGLVVQEVVDYLGTRSHAFLILFFCLPFLQPLPMLGLSTPLGLIISATGIFMAFGAKLWLPKFFLKKRISFKLVESSCHTLTKILSKSEKMIKPRHEDWFTLRIVKLFNGFLIALFGIFLSMPIPIPFSNSVPAYFFLFNSIAWLERDALLLFISIIAAGLGVIFFVGIAGGVLESIHFLRLKFGI